MRFKAVSSATGIRQVMVSKDLLQLRYCGWSDGIALTRCAHPRPRTRMECPVSFLVQNWPGPFDPGQRATDAARVSRSRVHARPPCSEKGRLCSICGWGKRQATLESATLIGTERVGWRGWIAVCAYLARICRAPGWVAWRIPSAEGPGCLWEAYFASTPHPWTSLCKLAW